MFVLIVDYGSGNIKSVYNSVKRTLQNLNKSSDLKVSSKISDIRKADKIILPGVGSFDQCMNRIQKMNGLVEETPDRDEDLKDLGTTTKSVKYSVLYMKAVKALQEAMTRIETLEAEVKALKGE